VLKDKVAIISGAIRGPSFEMSKEFTERGAIVIACLRSKQIAENYAKLIKGVISKVLLGFPSQLFL
jgi:NAD(P)-dependent dehydrogenase (short-subunit alcohol dehydrogenase family)